MKITPERIRAAVEELESLLTGKFKGYGNSLETSPLSKQTTHARIMGRLDDKFARIQNLKSHTDAFVDCMQDIAGYCILWLAAYDCQDIPESEDITAPQNTL